MRRKLLFYTHCLGGGGAERVWALLASGFAQRGYDVTLAVEFESSDNMGFLDAAVRMQVLGRSRWKATLNLARLIAREKPDVTLSAIGACNLKHFVAAGLVGRLNRAIISYHGYYDTEPQFLCRLSYLATPLATRLCARSICVSEGLLEHVKTTFHGDARRTVRIYNPVYAGALPICRSEADLQARGPVVVACGRMVPRKRFPLLVRAFARAAPAPARLLLLGEGSERGHIEAEVRRCGIADRVTFAGYVTEPWRLYQEASCFVLASESEPFGLVVVEALENGLPVVSTDCDGPREILADGKFGTLVPIDDESALASAIAQTLAHPGDPGPRVQRAAEFSTDVGVDRYAELIEGILAKGPARQLMNAH